MSKTIGRNDRCPCVSGKKYKNCHGDMQDQPVLDPKLPLESALNKRMNEARIKHCIHPNKTECSGNIIRAHSIQNNRILTRIGDQGEVYMVKALPTQTRMKYKFKRVGRTVATTFTGFCGTPTPPCSCQSRLRNTAEQINRSSCLHIELSRLNITKN